VNSKRAGLQRAVYLESQPANGDQAGGLHPCATAAHHMKESPGFTVG